MQGVSVSGSLDAWMHVLLCISCYFCKVTHRTHKITLHGFHWRSTKRSKVGLEVEREREKEVKLSEDHQN
jgi:hypothetical protein